MGSTIKITAWSSNGLQQKAIRTCSLHLRIEHRHHDVIHFTNKNYAKIPHYIIYDTKYPPGKSHGASAIIIKNNHLHNKTTFDYFQATTVSLEISSEYTDLQRPRLARYTPVPSVEHYPPPSSRLLAYRSKRSRG